MHLHRVSLLLIVAGCATMGTAQSDQRSHGSSVDTPASPAPTPTMSSPSPAEDRGPRLVLPVTGGAPVMALPLGDGLYLPVTGGPPVVGIPVGP